MTAIHQHQLDNGLRLVAEPIEGVKSLALTLLLPAGVAHEPAGQQGVATMLAEMVCRGAGDRDARAHSEALDHLGVQRGSNAAGIHLRLTGTMIGSKLPEALPLLLDMVRRPKLPAEHLEPSRALALQTLDAVDDEPQQKVMLELRCRHLPQPFGRPLYGDRGHIERMTLEALREHWRAAFVPEGAVLGVAGCFAWDDLRGRVEDLLDDWRGARPDPVDAQPAPRGYAHLAAETTQVHIGVAHDAVAENDDHAMLQRAAVGVLSGGMSGRLFTEVREKRGLCYAVGARYSADKRRGMVLSYTGTTTARAQETLDVLTGELRRISAGVARDEFDRAIVGMKSRLVMQGESTGARAAAIAADQYIFGRPRTLDDIAAEIDAITLERLNAFLAGHKPEQMTVVTIGPNELKLDGLRCFAS